MLQKDTNGKTDFDIRVFETILLVRNAVLAAYPNANQGFQFAMHNDHHAVLDRGHVPKNVSRLESESTRLRS